MIQGFGTSAVPVFINLNTMTPAWSPFLAVQSPVLAPVNDQLASTSPLQNLKVWSPKDDEPAYFFAQRVIYKYGRTTTSKKDCYEKLTDALKYNYSVYLQREPYKAAETLSEYNGYLFTELRGKTGRDVASLPAGAIVVWGKSEALPEGDITLALGHGTEFCSTANLRKNNDLRVFMPK